MMFADEQNLLPAKDPRKDIVLTNVTTEMTTGGLVQQKVAGTKAIYSEAVNDLVIQNIQVAAIGEDRATRSITRADLGQIYFEAQPAAGIGRKDMKFAGGVLYRSPKADDPTTDSMRLMSELILWDESAQKFISPYLYEMLLFPKGKAPVRQQGKGFEATQDLTRFVVKAGAVTTDMHGDPMEERKKLEEQFDVWRERVEKATGDKPVRPPPIKLPPRL